MRTTLLLLTSLFTVSLAACSDDGSDSRGSATEVTTTVTATATDPTGSTTGGGTTAAESTAAESTALPTTEPLTTTEPMTTTGGSTTESSTTGEAVDLSCENYCGLYTTGCADFKEYDNNEACLAQCKQWPPGEANATAGDTLGCRLYHVGVANTSEPAVHCPHAGPNGAATCVEAGAPTCDAYCTQYFASCTADLDLYAGDMAGCMTQCAAWWPGTMGDAGGDSVGCRLYHAGAAMADAATHCPHAGPGGAGVCVVAP
ncbi:MAG: hypothetical protein H0T76_05340 [Nannocystis sp.]|nr:hypothetical protein [Nannocystis sp.]MBA3545888.1 hypothetical protein [Nannocystis sp.]